MMLVSVSECGYWCVLVRYSVGTTRGPVGDHSERLGTCYYTVKQKREILGNAGLQHVLCARAWRRLE